MRAGSRLQVMIDRTMLGALQDPDIKLLRMFHVIAQCGGFSAAQAQLNLSQSAISTQMAQLEARLGCRLCERGRGVFKLTNHGKAVIKASAKLFGALEDFRTEVAESQGRLTGELRLGLIDNCVTHDDPRIRDAIFRFVEVAGEEARISLFVVGAVELEQQVLDDRLHLGIGVFHHQIESIDYAPIMTEDHMLYCARGHPFFEMKDEAIDASASTRYVSWGYSEGLPGGEPPFTLDEVASSPHIEGVAYLILSGSYVGYLPTHYAQTWVGQGLIRPIRPDRTRRSSPICLIRRKSARVSRLVQTFLDAIGLQPANDAAGGNTDTRD